MRSPRRSTLASVVVALVAIISATSACSEDVDSGASAGGSPTSVDAGSAACADAPSIVECVPEGSMLSELLPDSPTAATGIPIRIGMINQEGTALGSFPELTAAARSGGRRSSTPSSTASTVDRSSCVTCITTFSPRSPRACAQELVSKEVARSSAGSTSGQRLDPVLEQNQHPVRRRHPHQLRRDALSPSRSSSAAACPGRSPPSGWGSTPSRSSTPEGGVVYGDFASIKARGSTTASRRQEARRHRRGRHPVPGHDHRHPAGAHQGQRGQPRCHLHRGRRQRLHADDEDRARAGHHAPPSTWSARARRPRSPTRSARRWRAASSASKGPRRPRTPTPTVYFDAVAKYDYEAQAAGTVAFRGIMNLYAAMRRAGCRTRSRRTRSSRVPRAAKDHRSFSGHHYTCDGEQIADYPAFCAPQQILGTAGRDDALTGWIDVPDWCGLSARARTDHHQYLQRRAPAGAGSVIAVLAIGIVLTYRASDVVNFAHAAMGMFLAYAYYGAAQLRRARAPSRRRRPGVASSSASPSDVHVSIVRPCSPRCPSPWSSPRCSVPSCTCSSSDRSGSRRRWPRSSPRSACSSTCVRHATALGGGTGAASLQLKSLLPDGVVHFGDVVVPTSSFVLAGDRRS